MTLFENLRRRLRKLITRPSSWEHRRRPCVGPTMHLVHLRYAVEYDLIITVGGHDGLMLFHCENCKDFHVVPWTHHTDIRFCRHFDCEPDEKPDEMDDWYHHTPGYVETDSDYGSEFEVVSDVDEE